MHLGFPPGERIAHPARSSRRGRPCPCRFSLSLAMTGRIAPCSRWQTNSPHGKVKEIHPRRWPVRSSSRPTGDAGRRWQREFEAEGAAVAGAAIDGDPAAHQGRQALGQGEAKADAAVLAVALPSACSKGRKRAAVSSGVMPMPVSATVRVVALVGGKPQADLAGSGELDGIGEQDVDDLARCGRPRFRRADRGRPRRRRPGALRPRRLFPRGDALASRARGSKQPLSRVSRPDSRRKNRAPW